MMNEGSNFSFLALRPADEPVGGTQNTSVATELASAADLLAAFAALLSFWGETVRGAAPDSNAAHSISASGASAAPVAPPAVT